MNIDEAKKSLRKKFLNLRNSLDFDTSNKLSKRISNNFFETISLNNNDVVAIYMPIAGEVDSMHLYNRLLEKGCKICLPKIIDKKKPLTFKSYSLDEKLIKNQFFKVFEPSNQNAEMIPNILIVPLLSYDKNNNRLGYGGGFYDLTITNLKENNKNLLCVGLAYSIQETANIPINKFDIALDIIINEKN